MVVPSPSKNIRPARGAFRPKARFGLKKEKEPEVVSEHTSATEANGNGAAHAAEATNGNGVHHKVCLFSRQEEFSRVSSRSHSIASFCFRSGLVLLY